MDEFGLIQRFFKTIDIPRQDVIFGIGDDAACLQVPAGMDLLVSCDSLISGRHFLDSWDAYDIAIRSVMVNISDIAAMGGKPCWLLLSLTIPEVDEAWLSRFSLGLKQVLKEQQVSLVGGNTSRGPLAIHMTIHGLVPRGRALRRNGAKPSDYIYLTGELGAAALAVNCLQVDGLDANDRAIMMDALLHPKGRSDFSDILLQYASSAIDISDGLSGDLSHIALESAVGAVLFEDKIPVHPLVKKYKREQAIDFSLHGGDDYELCFTLPENNKSAFERAASKAGLVYYEIGRIEALQGLRIQRMDGSIEALKIAAYQHFDG